LRFAYELLRHSRSDLTLAKATLAAMADAMAS
jgi:hypothetical protein